MSAFKNAVVVVRVNRPCLFVTGVSHSPPFSNSWRWVPFRGHLLQAEDDLGIRCGEVSRVGARFSACSCLGRGRASRVLPRLRHPGGLHLALAGLSAAQRAFMAWEIFFFCAALIVLPLLGTRRGRPVVAVARCPAGVVGVRPRRCRRSESSCSILLRSVSNPMMASSRILRSSVMFVPSA